MQKYFNVTIQLDRLLYISILYWYSFSMVVQEDLRLDYYCNFPSSLSLDEILGYQCTDVQVEVRG